jgi:hypothetical protein
MALPKCPIQEYRESLRIGLNLDCRYTFGGIEYKAFIKDISLTGALLLSDFMPPWGSDISIKIETSHLKLPLILGSKIVRRDLNCADGDTAGAFAVAFNHSSPGLLQLIDELTNSQGQ